MALSFIVALAASCSGEAVVEHHADEPTPGEADGVGSTAHSADTRTVYVPAYSHLNSGEGRRMLLAITLSVRNVDPASTATLTQVEYFDTSGHRVRRYLRAPRTLRPLETAEFSVDTLDDRGGSGANFLVYWEGPGDAHPLLTETIMFGHVGNGYMSFTSRGVELAQPPALAPIEPDPTVPDPTVPDPTEPDPTVPDPTVPDPTEPDPTEPDLPD